MNTKPKDLPYCGVNRKRIKAAKPVFDHKVLLHLYNFVKRRYIIHLRKDVLKLSPPWTFDEVLQRYRFTNVRREHDRETRWVIDNITSNHNLCYEDKLLNVILFRLYNQHETAELISMPIKFSKWGLNWDSEWYRSLFQAQEIINPSVRFFTPAFLTSGMKKFLGKETGEPYTPMRVLKFMEVLLRSPILSEIKRCRAQSDVYRVLSKYRGIGEFLAYQIFVDYTYIKEFPFSENEYVVACIGCRKGLDLLFLDRAGMSDEECLFWLRDNIDRLFVSELGKDWDPKAVFWDLPEEDRCFNVMSLENCMCELSKYVRAKTGTGRPRRVYQE